MHSPRLLRTIIVIIIAPLLHNNSTGLAHHVLLLGSITSSNGAHPLRVRDPVAEDLGDLLERLALGLGEDEEEARGHHGVADEEDDVVPPADAGEGPWGELVEEEAGRGAGDGADCYCFWSSF